MAAPVDEWGSARMFNNWALLLQRRCPTFEKSSLIPKGDCEALVRCPFCRSDSRVTDTRDIANVGIRRRRRCIGCGNQWTTFETVCLLQRVEQPTQTKPGLTPLQQAQANLIKEKLRARQRAMTKGKGGIAARELES